MKQKHSWEITEEFWEAAEPLIPRKQRDPDREYRRKPGAGRPPMKPRSALAAIFYVLRTGIQWKALPAAFGASSSVHRSFQFWYEQGVFAARWKAGLAKYNEAKGIDWGWLSADGCMTKAPLALQTVGKNPTDRGKKGEQTPSSCRRRGSSLGAGSNRGQPA
jgi:transposase